MKKIAILFPGQGSQYIGMAKEFYDEYDFVHETFDKASEALGYDLAQVCFNSDEETLKQTAVTQAALLTTEVSLYKVLMNKYKIKPSFFAGHSLGEISALTCAGAIKFEDGVKLVRRRGELMQEAVAEGKGGMIAVTDIDSSMVYHYCKQIREKENYVDVSIYNTANQTVVSGLQDGLFELEEVLTNEGANITRLKVSAPFHCALMEPAAIELQKLLYTYEFQNLQVPVLSNVNGLPYTGKYAIVENLTQQMTMPVQWNQSMYFLDAQEVNFAIDIGPKATLRNMIRRGLPNIESYSFDKSGDRDTLEKCLNNKEMDKMMFLHRCMGITVCTQNLNWNTEEYQNGVVKPYNELKTKVEQLKAAKAVPTDNDIKQAYDLLLSNFKTKHTPKDEIEERIEQLADETNADMAYINKLA